jgi:hypothetical protein
VAIYDPRYEVAWPLSEDGDDEDVIDIRDQAVTPARENFESLARFAGLLAGAEVAAVTLCRGEGLIIELTDPPSPLLRRGAFVLAQTSNSSDDSWSVNALLEGTLRWCWCKPPSGFCSTALIGGPALVRSQRLVLVANRETRLSEVNLGLAASYLAQTRHPVRSPGAAADKGLGAFAEDDSVPEDGPGPDCGVVDYRPGVRMPGPEPTAGPETTPPSGAEAGW